MRKSAILTVLACAALAMAAAGNAHALRNETNSADISSDKRLYFVQITDTHLNEKDHHRRVEKIIKLVNALKIPIEFVALTGDITSGAIYYTNELVDITNLLAGFKPSVYAIPGNHDIGHDNAKNLALTLDHYSNYFGPLNYTVTAGGVVFVFLFTETLKEGYSIKNYDPLKWLRETLDKNSLPTVILHHSPSCDDFYNNASHKSWPDKNRADWESIIASHTNVKGVIGGHFHRDELHFIGATPYFVSSSVAGFWNRQASFRIYCWDGERLSYTTIYVEK